MKKHKCEMCDKSVLRISDHHIIPWWFSHDDSESNIMRLCASCHKKADASFNNLILYGKMNVTDDTTKRVTARYSKKYISNKTLFCFKLLKGVYYQDDLRYNIKTEHISIIYLWNYNKPRTPRTGIGSIINIRRRAKKAALSKGQTILIGK